MGRIKIAVLLKSVIDAASSIAISDDNKSISLSDAHYVVNPFDEYALEEALKIKDNADAEVIVVSLGGDESKTIIRNALAMGADSAILVKSGDTGFLTGRGVAEALAAALRGVSPDLILAGKQAIDDEARQVPERVAEILAMPHISAITRLSLDGMKATADCKIDGSLHSAQLSLPALFTTEKGMNTPRYPTLPNIMKAKLKEIREVGLDDLNLSPAALAPNISISSIAYFRCERAAKIFEGSMESCVRELVSMLHEKEKSL